MGVKEKLLVAGGLLLCPGDEIAASFAQAINTTGAGNNAPASALLYEHRVLHKIKKTDSRGNELIAEFPIEDEPNSEYYPYDLEATDSYEDSEIELFNIEQDLVLA